jgi:glutamyl-tRNA reductase
MTFIVCGVNHKTASLALREKIALTNNKENQLICELLQHEDISEAAAISTCNRSEIYCEAANATMLPYFLAGLDDTILEEIRPHIYIYQDLAAIEHLIRVAVGLDSMVLGEAQILGQLKKSYQNAQLLRSIGHHLQAVFQYVFYASKEIREQSSIGFEQVSVASVAADLIDKIHLGNNRCVFIIGSGDTATMVANYLHKKQQYEFLVASRTNANSRNLADKFAAKVISIQEIHEHLALADIIISATSCPLPFINKTHVETAMLKRHHVPMIFLDLAVPRDIEENITAIPNVSLYNLDDLSEITKQGLSARQSAAAIAEGLIAKYLIEYQDKQNLKQIEQDIVDHKNELAKISQAELTRSLKKLQNGADPEAILQDFAERITNKYAHLKIMELNNNLRNKVIAQ